AGQLHLGVIATGLTGIIPEVVALLRAQHPKIEYFIRPGSSVNLYQAVVVGELDAAIIVHPQFALPKSTGWLTLRHEPLVLIAPQTAARDDTSHMIRSHPFIRYDRHQWGGHLV